MFKKRPFFNKALKVLLISNALIYVAGAMMGPIYALFVEEVGGNLLDASITGGVYALAAGIVVLLSGSVSDKIKESELIVVAGYAIMALGFMMYIFVSSIAFLLIVQVVIGIGEAIMWPAFDALYSKHLDLKKRGRQWAVWEAMSYWVTAAGAIIGGVIVTFVSFDALFVIMAALCFIAAVYVLLTPRKVI